MTRIIHPIVVPYCLVLLYLKKKEETSFLAIKKPLRRGVY
jgi:hypothetical protein